MKTCIVIFFIVSVISFSASAQINNPLINSGQVIADGLKLHDNKKYKEAIDEYNKIARSDTNYVTALAELSYSYYADSQFNRSLEAARLGMSLFPQKYTSFSLQAASSLDDMGKPGEAIKLYDSILKLSPQSFLSHFNKGVVNYKQKDFDEAKKNFQNCLLINPYYSSAHYFLGKIYMLQGNLVPAILAFNTYLLIAPGGKYLSNTVTALGNISKVSDDILDYVKNKSTDKEDNFSFQQDILLSKLALDKQYKLKADIEDNIVRQIQVVNEKLEFNRNDKGFCMQYYVPFYIAVLKDGNFEAMIYSTFSGVNNKDIERWNKDHKKDKQVFIDNASAYFDVIKRTQVLDPVQRGKSNFNYVYDNQVFLGKGIYSNDKDPYPVGKWEYSYDNGAIKAVGNYNDSGNKDGQWIYYYDDGRVKEKSGYVNGVVNGLSEGWFNNGNKWYSQTYINGKVNGVQTINYYNEKTKSIIVFKEDTKNGEEKSFDFKGNLVSTNNYTDNKLEGWSRSYYIDGKIKNEILYKDDKEEGTYKSYFNSGKLYMQGDFKNGMRQGLWTTYYEDGVVSEKTVYLDNEITGEFTEYFPNTKLKRKGTYYKKKQDGKVENYDDDGKIFGELVYDRGKLKEVNFYDKEGKVISNTTTRKGAANIIFYSAEGRKNSEGYFNKDGNKDGKFVSYYTSGKISEESYWKDGVKEGSQVNYYPDGKISKTTGFKNGEEDGYVKDFYANGVVSSEGWRVEGRRQQHYLFYNPIGNLTNRENFLNDDLDGYSEFLEPGNIRTIEYFYKNGWLSGVTQFDTTNKIISKNEFEKGKGPLIYKHFNGKNSSVGNYDNYMLNGPYTYYYFDGSLSVTSFYKNDLLDSTYKDYYYGGILKAEGKFINGLKEGKWKYYYSTGKISTEENYIAGNYEGESKIYNPDGKLGKLIHYKDNTFEGPLEIYGENNQLAVRLNYKDGFVKSYQYEEKAGTLTPEIPLKSASGKITAKYPNGRQSTEFTFVENVLDGERKIFYSNGNTYMEGNRINGDIDGLSKSYYPNGSVWDEENYVLGELHGTCKYYYPNGKIEKEENYYNNQQHGISKYYDEQGKLKQVHIYYYGVLLSVK